MEKITLNEWMQLSPEQRDDIKEKWKENWNEWCYLLDEAIERFKNEYGEIQEISSVRPAYGCEPVSPSYSVSRLTTEPWIAVTTSLKKDELIKRLPSDYAYFKVVQDSFGDTGQVYLNEWIAILKNFLKWTEEQTIEWAEKHHSADLAGENEWFDHEFPCHYVAELLVPENKLVSMPGLERAKFLGEIEKAVYYQSKNPLDPDYDWTTARQRINDVLSKIEVSLPD